MDVEMKYLPPTSRDPKELRKQHDMFTVLKWKNAPTRQEGVSMDTLLQRMNDLERNMIATIRGGRNVRGQSRHPRRGDRQGGQPKIQQRQQPLPSQERRQQTRQGMSTLMKGRDL